MTPVSTSPVPAVASAGFPVVFVHVLIPSLTTVPAPLSTTTQPIRWASFSDFLRDPLLWSLHLGYAWVAIGLAVIAFADLAGAIPWSVGVHAQTAGAIGTMVLAVMTRVALGHTGRPLVAPRAAVAAYLLVTAGALVRTLGALVVPDAYLQVIVIAGLLWAAAFAAFLVHYAPILTRSRVDGGPG